MKKSHALALLVILAAVFVFVTSIKKTTPDPLPQADFQKYLDFDDTQPSGKDIGNGVFESQKYGFRITLPDTYKIAYRGSNPFGKIKDNPRNGGECMVLVTQEQLAAQICINVNPFNFSLEEFKKEYISEKFDIRMLGKNNYFIFDFEFRKEIAELPNVDEVKSFIENEIVPSMEYFDI